MFPMFFLCFPYVLPTIIPAFSYDSYDFRFSEIQSESSVSILSYSHSHTFAYGNSPYIFLQSFPYVSYGHSIRFCPRRFRRMPLLKAAFLSFPTTYDLHTFSYDSISSSLCLCDNCFLLFPYVLHTFPMVSVWVSRDPDTSNISIRFLSFSIRLRFRLLAYNSPYRRKSRC